jgi:hypothetical protein
MTDHPTLNVTYEITGYGFLEHGHAYADARAAPFAIRTSTSDAV